MPKLTPALSPGEPDPALLHKVAVAKRACLAAAALIGAFSLCGLTIPALGRILPEGWQLMRAGSALAALLSALSLDLSEARFSKRMHGFSMLIAGLVALAAGAFLVEYRFHLFPGLDRLLRVDGRSASPLPEILPAEAAGGFALLGIATAVIRVTERIAAYIADVFIFCLCLLVLVLAFNYIFGVLRMFGLSTSMQIVPQTLVCLLLLTVVAVLRRSEYGVFAIFLGRGIGSTIARSLAPILMVLPFLGEIGRSHLIQANLIPAHYVIALVASLATVLSFVLLLFLAWRIHSMETKIHDLSLRDELTGLYNLRGFHLLAEQALRLAQRSELPFSVLFIDLDGLKKINDAFGHNEGSRFLSEAGELLKANFRETDVIGRIGGDEFAVAGQLSRETISIAAERLRKASAARSNEARWWFPLSFSVGYVTSDEHAHESLKDLLARADEAMYEEKRGKKLPAS